MPLYADAKILSVSRLFYPLGRRYDETSHAETRTHYQMLLLEA
jgi:hypothetical protein